MRLVDVVRTSLLGVIAAALVSSAWAQPPSAREAWLKLGSLRIYEGDARRALEPIQFEAWGSGIAGETWGPNLFYIGPRVIQILSQGYHSGGILRFAHPLDVRLAFEEKGWMMELRIRLAKPTEAAPASFPSLGNEAGAAAGAGAGRQSGRAGSAAQAQEPRPRVEGVEIPEFPPTQYLRVRLDTPSGPLVASRIPVDYPGTLTRRGWVHIAFPIALFRGLGDTIDGRIFRMAISTDRPQLLYIGQIRLTRDLQPLLVNLTATPPQPQAGKTVRLRVRVDGGLSRVRVRWDFDDSDGVTVQAEGERVAHVFPTPGAYTVTATVDDVIGAKAPVTKTVTVTVQ